MTLFTLAIFVIGIWALAFYASYTLHNDMEHTLSDQQFSTVSILAADINDELENRLKTLEMIAEKITPAMLGNAAATQTFLDSHISFKMLFNYGGVVMRLDGVAIAETPNHGRIGLNYSDRDHVIEALKGKTTIGKPVMGKTAHSPILSCAAPIRDAQGKVIGAVSGVTDLEKPNFLTKITDHGYGKTGGYLMVSLKTRTIVYATDKKRIMEVLPGPGFNPLIDRAIKGWEGSGITIRPSTGVEILSSVKGIPIAGWYAAAMMPTTEAFAPIYALQKHVLLATIFLTLLAGCLTWWMLKRQLAPALTTIKTLATLADTDQSPDPLPITRQDEIGELIGGFNRLLETLGKREEELAIKQRQLQTLNETLSAQVAEEVLKNRGKDILLLNQDKLAGIGQLAAGVAHEINNPMGFILSNLLMLKEYSDVEQKYRVALENALEDSCPEERRKQLGDLHQALDLPFVLKDIPLLISESLGGAERIKQIVLDLKDFARLDQGKMNQTDLNQCVQSTANIVRNEIRQVAELELQLNEIPLVICNSQQINQVIANILINASQAMDKHGVITVTSRQEGEEVVLSISDTGRGMTEEVRKRIFEPFFTTRDIGKGIGLGLSIAYGIIKQHDGEITVESELGKGATFTIRLPIKRNIA